MGGVTHGMFGTPEYRAYRNALNRCRRESDPRFGSYGGRGIEMRFDTFEEFFCCVGLRPNRKYSLDRIDTNGHYEAGNVRWATAAHDLHPLGPLHDTGAVVQGDRRPIQKGVA